MIDQLQMLMGRRVQISGRSPRVQVSPEFVRVQTPELVASTNAWMAQFFGYSELLPDGVVYELNRDTLVMNQATYEQVRAATKNRSTP